MLLRDLGLVALIEEESSEAWHYCAEGLTIADGLNVPTSVAFLLEEFAALAACTGAHERAIQLAGVARAEREGYIFRSIGWFAGWLDAALAHSPWAAGIRGGVDHRDSREHTRIGNQCQERPRYRAGY